SRKHDPEPRFCDPHLIPPPFRGRKEPAARAAFHATRCACGLPHLPQKGGGRRALARRVGVATSHGFEGTRSIGCRNIPDCDSASISTTSRPFATRAAEFILIRSRPLK